MERTGLNTCSSELLSSSKERFFCTVHFIDVLWAHRLFTLSLAVNKKLHPNDG